MVVVVEPWHRSSSFQWIEQHMPDAASKDAIDHFQAQAMPLLPALYRTALMLTHHQQNAEDLVQQTMLRAFRRIETFQPGTNMKAWLLTILRRLHIDQHRHNQSRIATDSLDTIGIDPAAAPEAGNDAWDGIDPEQLMQQIDDPTLAQALRSLSEPMRWVLLLVDVEQLSIHEAAAVLDVPEGTVKSRASRARAALRESIEPIARERGWLK